MRIFPEPPSSKGIVGKYMLILAVVLLAAAAGTFLFKTWVLYAWPKTTGVVVGARVATRQSELGATTCSAVYVIRYSVDGKIFFIEQGGKYFRGDCSSVTSGVESSHDKNIVVAYRAGAPAEAYIRPGFTIEFYVYAISFAGVGVTFMIFALVRIKLRRPRTVRT